MEIFIYGFLFTPKLPFVKRKDDRSTVFFGLDSEMPVYLEMLLGLHHALAMLTGIVTPLFDYFLNGEHRYPLGQEYLVAMSLMACGILPLVQIIRFRLFKSS